MLLKRLFESAVEKEVQKRLEEINRWRFMDERIDEISKRVRKLEDKLEPPMTCCVATPVEPND